MINYDLSIFNIIFAIFFYEFYFYVILNWPNNKIKLDIKIIKNYQSKYNHYLFFFLYIIFIVIGYFRYISEISFFQYWV